MSNNKPDINALRNFYDDRGRPINQDLGPSEHVQRALDQYDRPPGPPVPYEHVKRYKANIANILLYGTAYRRDDGLPIGNKGPTVGADGKPTRDARLRKKPTPSSFKNAE